LDVVGRADAGSRTPGGGVLRVAVIRLPRISNFTDIDPLAAEPGVAVQFTASPAEVAGADLAVLPGSRATVADLAWLRSSGLADALVARAAAGRPILGICGGFQMLTREIADDVESGSGIVPGLGLLPASVRFTAEKVLERPDAMAYGVHVTTAYAIHHGRVTVDDGAENFLDGCRAGAVWGTSWHGVLEEDGLRRAFLREVASLAGVDDFEVAADTRFAARREARIERLADAVVRHLDTGALRGLMDHGVPAALPFVPPGAPT
jgi:adenosylcobyric acid synthase